MGDKKHKLHDSNSDDDSSSRRKHKKSKSDKKSKDKYRDRSRSRERDKHRERGSEKSRDREKTKNKSKDTDSSKHNAEDDSRLTAAEKFNIFKKQREAAKAEESDKIVDDLFKDFIASKIREIEHDGGSDEQSKTKSRDKVVNSVEEINRFLDSEINSLNIPSSGSDGKSVAKDSVQEKVSVSTDENTGHAKQRAQNVTAELSKTLVKEAVADTVTSVPEEMDTGNEASDVDPKKSSGGFVPMLPRSLAVTETKDSKDETGPGVKKQVAGFKNFGIKLSSISKELIESGEVHKKGKRLEEGEVLSSSGSDSDSSDTEVEDQEVDDADLDKVSGTGSISDTDGELRSDSKSKKKKKKKKKGKHKKKKKSSREKEEGAAGDKDVSSSRRKDHENPRSRSKSPKKTKRSRSRERSRKRSRSHSRTRSRRSTSRGRRSRSRGRTSRKKRSRSKSKGRRSRSRERRSHSRSRKRSRSRSKGRRSRSRGRRSRSKGHKSRSRSRSPDRFWRSKYGDFDAYKFLKTRKRSRSKSRTPDRERDRFIDKEKKRMEDLRGKIDKTKLREIAIKNALSMAKTGGAQLDVTLKAGGKSVEELTEYCKRIQEKEDLKRGTRNMYESSSEDDMGPGDNEEEDEGLHHPFLVKESAPIIMDIKNFKQLPVVTPQERLAQSSTLRLQFPVSSGSQHREKEWVPVEPTPPQPPAPASKPKPGTSGGAPTMKPPPPPAIMPPPPEPPKPEIKVFEEPAPNAPSLDITAIVSERLNAVRKLAENPNDYSAKVILNQAQEKAKQWARSKDLPGQFVGSTGANIMSQEELMGDRRRQAWLKKDVFTSAAPVTGGIGMFLLQKMGWKQGTGLGKNNEGKVEPLMLDVKVDRKGLVTTGEGKKGGVGAVAKAPVVRDLSGKHPVSALGELCNKRKWGVPIYEVVHESGPAHRKDFLFKVRVNGTEFQPSIASNNKKLAKAQAATVCLQELGMIPRSGPI